MGLKEAKSAVNRLYDSLRSAKERDLDLAQPPRQDIADFQRTKEAYIHSSFRGARDELRRSLQTLGGQNASIAQRASRLLGAIDPADKQKALAHVEEVAELLSEAQDEPENRVLFNISTEHIPSEIKGEVTADLDELERCFNNRCYRSAVILCGRLLETALHRTYYDVTGKDILETNPGIGLGTLIAKLKEKGVTLDPGITQQIHLINQSRIFSVHKKQKPFTPTRDQAHAIVLFTIDTMNKLFR